MSPSGFGRGSAEGPLGVRMVIVLLTGLMLLCVLIGGPAPVLQEEGGPA